jgi:hypothetical protein
MNLPEAQILVSKYYSPLKVTRLLEEMAIQIWGK